MSKIIVNQLELRNFFSYGNQWQTVDLREGINVVLGHDMDKERSNGAGKTSFLEAIPFALFGQTSKGVAQNKIINWRNGKQCEVRLHFVKDGVPYIIHRGIKPGTFELYREGVVVPKLSDKRVFQLELEQDLIGMDYKAAEALLFQNANNMVSIFNTPKADKRRFIEKFFNLEIFSKAMEHTNGKLGNVTKRLSEIDMELSFKRRRIGELESTINSFVAPDLTVYEGDVVSLQVLYGGFIDNHPDLEDNLKTIQEEKADLVVRTKETEIELLKTKEKIGDYRLEIRTFTSEKDTLLKRLNAIGDLEEQKVKLGKVKEALTKFEGIQTKADETKTLREKIREEITEEKARLRESKVYRDQYKTEINQLKFQLENKTEEATCPTCYQEVDHEHIEHHLESQITGKQRELTFVGGEIANIEGLIQQKEMQFTDVSQRVVDLEKQLEQKRQLEQALAKLQGVEEKVKEQKEIYVRIEVIDATVVKYEIKLNELREIVEEIQGRFDDMVQEQKDYDEQINKYKDKIRERDRLSSELDKAESIFKSQKEIHDRVMAEYQVAVASKSQLETEVSEFDGETKKLHKMKDYLEYVKETLKDENVKQYAIGNIIPFLQQQTNHYLAETGHNYYVELDAWLDGTIKGYGVGECEFGNMSGGEGKSIDLALKFAMMDVARRQAGSYLDILVLDELLDSSIDSYGIEKTFDIIRLKQREDNLKVFVVSHREEVADLGADNIYRVVKEDGFSTITL